MRVQNELFPLEFDDLEKHSRVRVIEKDEVTCLHIDFKSRKNRPNGAKIQRKCTCEYSPEFCPPHVVLRWLRVTGRRTGGRLFNFNY